MGIRFDSWSSRVIKQAWFVHFRTKLCEKGPIGVTEKLFKKYFSTKYATFLIPGGIVGKGETNMV